MGETHTNIVEKAVSFAAEKHKTQYRKTEKILYISHLVSVALILHKYNFSENIIAAGLLHDTLEDTDASEQELLENFGPEVLQYVKEVTENKSLPKPERKELYIENLRNASTGALAIACADKIHNTKSYILNRIHTQEQVNFMEKCLAVFKEKFPHPIVTEFERILSELKGS